MLNEAAGMQSLSSAGSPGGSTSMTTFANRGQHVLEAEHSSMKS